MIKLSQTTIKTILTTNFLGCVDSTQETQTFTIPLEKFYIKNLNLTSYSSDLDLYVVAELSESFKTLNLYQSIIYHPLKLLKNSLLNKPELNQFKVSATTWYTFNENSLSSSITMREIAMYKNIYISLLLLYDKMPNEPIEQLEIDLDLILDEPNQNTIIKPNIFVLNVFWTIKEHLTLHFNQLKNLYEYLTTAHYPTITVINNS